MSHANVLVQRFQILSCLGTQSTAEFAWLPVWWVGGVPFALLMFTKQLSDRNPPDIQMVNLAVGAVTRISVYDLQPDVVHDNSLGSRSRHLLHQNSNLPPYGNHTDSFPAELSGHFIVALLLFVVHFHLCCVSVEPQHTAARRCVGPRIE